MCGIIAAFETTVKNKEDKESHRAQDVNSFIINQYEDQHHRGSRGFGSILIDENQNFETLRATEPIKYLLDLYMNKSKMIISQYTT